MSNKKLWYLQPNPLITIQNLGSASGRDWIFLKKINTDSNLIGWVTWNSINWDRRQLLLGEQLCVLDNNALSFLDLFHCYLINWCSCCSLWRSMILHGPGPYSKYCQSIHNLNTKITLLVPHLERQWLARLHLDL